MGTLNSQTLQSVPVREDLSDGRKVMRMALNCAAVQDVALTDSGVSCWISKPFGLLTMHRQILNILAGKAAAEAP